MSTKIDLTGGRFGRLRVIGEAGRKRKEVLWECVCDCGNTVFVPGYSLRKGHTKSCGCLVSEKAKEANTKHGLYGTRIHGVYTNMKTRCYNPKYYLFKRYGGRGITVCDEWLGPDGLSNFVSWALKNGYSENLSLDRIDNDKGYSPDNCRWVTMKQQQNNRSNNRIITVNGVKKTMAEWADATEASYATLQWHVKAGDVENYLKRLAYAPV